MDGILGAGPKQFCLGVVCCGRKEGWKKRLSCLGGDGGGDGGGLGGKKILLLLLLSLFVLKNVKLSFNTFNLLCISISTVFGVFLSVHLQHLFYLHQACVKANRQQDFAHQK